MRKTQKEYAIFRRVGKGLFAANAKAEEALACIPEHGDCVADVRLQRNLDRLRAYWAYLRDAINATECATCPEVLHDDLKVGLKYIDSVTYKDGTTRVYPASIALTEMEEDDFITFFKSAQKLLAEKYGYGGQL